MKFTRRNFLASTLLATTSVNSFIHANAFAKNKMIQPLAKSNADNLAFKLSIFSKNLHWLDYPSMAATAAELGFDGIDLTVRPEGHVSPERVTGDLPKAVEAAKKEGLKISSIVTAIEDADDPFTESILKTASGLGISFYRMGWLPYNDKTSIEDNLKQFTQTFKKLETLNKKYNIYGVYQNHSGNYFGSPIWDLAQVLNNIHAQWTGSQYDVYHATVEGANAWPLGLKLLTPYIKMINIKDFHWTNKKEKWVTEGVPLGQGMVDYKNYFSLLKEYNIKCPVSVHYEYPLGGADRGAKVISMAKSEVLAAMKKDVDTLKAWLKDAALG